MDYLKKLYAKYFSVNLKDYSNINIDLEINQVLFFLALGLCAACIFINYYQGNISLLFKKLIRLEAFSEEKSNTLKDLGLKDHKPTKILLIKNSGSIKRVINVVGRKRLTYEEFIESEKEKKQSKKHLISKSSDENSAYDNNSRPTKTSENLQSEIDFETAKIYIIPEMREYAEHAIKSGTSPIKTALYCILICSFFVVLIISMPTILTIVNNTVA